MAAAVSACSNAADTPADYSGVAYPMRGPTFESAGRRLGYVANRDSDTLSVLDLDAMTLLGSVPVGRDPVDIDGPRHVVIDPGQGLAYIALSYPFANESPHALSLGSTPRTGYVQALQLSDLSAVGELRVDVSPSDLALSAAGVLAVSHYDTFRALQSDSVARRANLVFVDPARAIAGGEALAHRVAVCAVPAAMAFNGDGSRVFVACTGEDVLAVVDTARGEVLSRVPAGSSVVNKPYALVGDLERARLLVANQVASTVSVFDMSDTPNLLSTLAIPGVPFFAVWASEANVLVPFQNPSGVALLDAASGAVLQTVQYSDDDCMNPVEVSMSRDLRLRLVCEGDHHGPGALVELDPATLAVKSRVSLGVYPERLAIREP